jgi:exonuclease VII small subunit
MLIRFCKEKLQKTDDEVKNILEELEKMGNAD